MHIFNVHTDKTRDLMASLKKKKKNISDFIGFPVAKTLSSQCRGLRFDPWSGS